MIGKRILMAFALAIVLLAACAPAPAAGTAAPAANTPAAQPTAAGGQAGAPLFSVVGPDGKSTPFARAALEGLPQSTVEVEGKSESGPALLEVLKAAGITDFQQVTLTGDVVLALAKDQITSDVLLDFTNRGTVKLAATSIAKNKWVKDITKIEVK